MLWQSLKMAWNSVISNKLRSFLTMLGIIIGVLALVVLVSIASGATSEVTDVVSSLGTDLLTVTILDDKERPIRFSELNELKALPHMGEISPSAIDMQSISAYGKSDTCSITGTTGAFFNIEGLKLNCGRYFHAADVDNHVNVAIINEDIASDMLKAEENWQALSQKLDIGGVPFTVIGVLEKDENDMSTMFSFSPYQAYIPYTCLMRLSDSVASISTFYCNAIDAESLDLLEQEVTNWLYKRLGEDEEAYLVINLSTIMNALDQVMQSMAVMVGGIAAISLLVGGIGIMNIMLVSVTERTREIGIRKAIGADEGSILIQFLIEALMLSLLGCFLGICVSWGLIRAINHISNHNFSMDPSVVLVASVFSICIGLIFGLYPARKAARKKPIDALHFGG
ncbi:MAG: ABC transporter permease [Blautia sp.]|nr:ABC transporter permease [Blautia sp.]